MLHSVQVETTVATLRLSSGMSSAEAARNMTPGQPDAFPCAGSAQLL
jgi:hypothetical protein